VDYAIAMDKGHGLTHLANKDPADSFGEDELIVHHSIKKLATFNAVKKKCSLYWKHEKY